MVVWHNTSDAVRIPEFVQEGDHVSLWIGSYPIEPDQSVWVELKTKNVAGDTVNGQRLAEWHSNDEPRHNSYWVARVGPFHSGDRVEYQVKGRVRDQEVVDPNTYTFEVY